ncbi:MAG: hypothetical protein ABI113_06960, partial [Mucilaginibacter sp.]
MRCCMLLGCLVLLCLANRAGAQQAIVIHGSDFGKHNQLFFVDSLWFFHAGELPGGSRAATTTAGWDTLHSPSFGKTNAPRHWSGMGWFGLWIKLDTGLVNRKLFMSINHDGASEIFMDGKPLGGFGIVGHSAQQMQAIRAPRELMPLWIADTRPHLLTVRYSNFFGV